MNAVAPLLTWLVVLVEFLVNLVGMHPTDARRDLNLAVGAFVLVLVQIPLLVRWRRMVRAGGRSALPTREIAMTVIRLGVAVYMFWFIHGISHGVAS